MLRASRLDLGWFWRGGSGGTREGVKGGLPSYDHFFAFLQLGRVVSYLGFLEASLPLLWCKCGVLPDEVIRQLFQGLLARATPDRTELVFPVEVWVPSQPNLCFCLFTAAGFSILAFHLVLTTFLLSNLL